ncbi:MAG: FAD-dependent thymidylate synthase [Nitrospinota bacterium]|nr:FAD-dependent thymidylate synthase [Nitrospinota bacterium]
MNPAGAMTAGKTRRIYLLKDLPPEVVAVAFAKTSRSPEAFDEIARELTDEASAQFHEKWVVGYGHASVAEHAVLSIAIENVSRFATEAIESNRLASYTEKSSRYQVFSPDDYYVPEEIAASPLAGEYRETTRWLFDNYLRVQNRLDAFLRESGKLPRRDGESERGYAVRVRAYALDRARFLLPISALANVGMTANARVLEHAIRKMLSHELGEVRRIGESLKEVCREAVPTLVKYADYNPYLAETREALDSAAETGLPGEHASEENYTRILEHPEDPETALAAAILYPHGDVPYETLRGRLAALPGKRKEEIIEEALRRLDRFDIPIREMEHLNYTFECLVDQGAYLDLKRHRMCTQSVQPPTIRHGFLTPELIDDAGVRDDYMAGVERAEAGYERFSKGFPNEARYFVLNAHRRRMLWTLNLREIMHVVKLRSGPGGHFTYRRVAQQMHREIERVHPFIARFIEVNLEEASGR